MSAIWGIINLSNAPIDDNKIRIFKDFYSTKKIDKFCECKNNSTFLGVGVQFTSSDSKEEQFPYSNDELSMVADCIIDNSSDLISAFNFEQTKPISDGAILFKCISNNFKKTLEEASGCFSFVTYHKKERKVTLCADHCSTRSLYFFVEDNCVYFSTLLEPLSMMKTNLSPNDRWFNDYFSNHDLSIYTTPEITPYKDIFRVVAGEYVTVSANHVKTTKYWNPYSKSRKHFIKDSELNILFHKIWKKCVTSEIREGYNTGILLSGGLDSNAVFAYAAPYLNSKNEKIYSFTSISPISQNRHSDSEYYQDDETPYIKMLEKKHKNMIPSFINTDKNDCIEINEKLFEIFGVPYKTIANIPWMYDAYKAAYKSNCRILLSGQYGNITVSYGNFDTLLKTLLIQGRWIEFLHEFRMIHDKYRISRKKYIKYLLTSKDILSHSKMRKYMFDKNALHHVAEAETALSLETGIISRDPTRSKEFIEFVLSLPLKAFCKNGENRRLVRVYMNKLIPEEIAKCYNHKGKQGSDSYVYIKNHAESIKSYCAEQYKNCHYDTLFPHEFFLDKLNINEFSDFDYTELIYGALTARYITNHFS